MTNNYTEGVRSRWTGIWQGLKSAMYIFVCFRSIFLPTVCMVDGRGWNRQGDWFGGVCRQLNSGCILEVDSTGLGMGDRGKKIQG